MSKENSKVFLALLRKKFVRIKIAINLHHPLVSGFFQHHLKANNPSPNTFELIFTPNTEYKMFTQIWSNHRFSLLHPFPVEKQQFPYLKTNKMLNPITISDQLTESTSQTHSQNLNKAIQQVSSISIYSLQIDASNGSIIQLSVI